MNDLKISGVGSFTVLMMIVGGVSMSAGGVDGGNAIGGVVGVSVGVLVGFFFVGFCVGVVCSGGSGLDEDVPALALLLVMVSHEAGGSPRELVVE